MGSIFPLVPPLKVNVKNKGEWNTFRIVMDWPRCGSGRTASRFRTSTSSPSRNCATGCAADIWARVALVPDPLSQPARPRTAGKVTWTPLYGPRTISPSGTFGAASRSSRRSARCCTATATGTSPPTKSTAISSCSCTSRHVWHHNGGVLFRTCRRTRPRGRHYEIQLHDVEGAHYPTGSLYSVKRAAVSADRAGEVVAVPAAGEGRHVPGPDQRRDHRGVRPAGQSRDGPIELQAHDAGRWTEYKEIKIRRL